MTEELKQILCDLIAQHGRELVREPKRLEGMLNDACAGQHRGARRVLVDAVQERVVEELLDLGPSEQVEVVVGRAQQRLVDNLAVAPDAALWAIHAWAAAFQVNTSTVPVLSASRTELAPGRSPGIMPVPGLTQKRRIVVARKGPADFRSIQLAIDSASPGDEVVVKPGVYREALSLNKSLSLMGDGEAIDIIIQYAKDYCLNVLSDTASVKGLTFRSLAVTGDETLHGAIMVSAGDLRIEGCNIQALATGLIVFGNAAIAQLLQCQVSGKDAAISVTDGHATIDGCDIFTGGIHVGKGAEAIVRRCKIHGIASCGIGLTVNSRVTVEESDIFENDIGVLVSGASMAIVRLCNIHCKSHGVAVSEGNVTIQKCTIRDSLTNDCVMVIRRGVAVIEDCEIMRGKKSGITIDREAKATIERCQIHGLEHVGIQVAGKATIKDCNLSHNKTACVVVDNGDANIDGCDISSSSAGVLVNRNSIAVIQKCRIHNSHCMGVQIAGKATVMDCQSFENNKSNMLVSAGGQAIIRRCQIRSSLEGNGVKIQEKSKATIDNCEISHNKIDGVFVGFGSEATIYQCQIHSSLGGGIGVFDKGNANIKECNIVDNTAYGIEISKASETTIVKCRIEGNGGFGISVGNDCRTQIANCEIGNNTLGDHSFDEGSSVDWDEKPPRQDTKKDFLPPPSAM